MPSFLKLATFVFGFFHCFQMYILNLRHIHSSQDSSVRFISATRKQPIQPQINTFTSCITLRTLRSQFRFERSFSVFLALSRDFRCSPPIAHAGCKTEKPPPVCPVGVFLFYREKIKSATIKPIGNTMIFFRIWMAGVEGFEPSARGFGDRCSTN